MEKFVRKTGDQELYLQDDLTYNLKMVKVVL